MLSLLAAIAITGIVPYGRSQSAAQLVLSTSDGIVRLATGDFDTRINRDSDVLKALQQQKDVYGFEEAGKELVLDKTLDTAFGQVYRFQQVKNGISVFGRGLNVSVGPAGDILSVSGNYLKDIRTRTTPDFSQEEAAAIFLSAYQTAQIQSMELAIYSLNDHAPSLTHNVTAVIDGALSRFFLADITGMVLDEIPLESDHMPPRYNSTITKSSQTDFYGESKAVDLERQGVSYYLNDAARNIILMNFRNQTQQQGSYYMSASKVFNDGLAVTALLNTIGAFDYYTKSENIGVSIRGVDHSVTGTHRNKEAFIILGLHYGQDFQNAFCSFRPDYVDPYYGRYMTLMFGDGHPSGLYYPALAQDIVGHEYQHAMTGYTAGLIYSNASGAINEAYSDIFGALIENHPQSDDRFWIIGEDATVDQRGTRSMKDPTDYGYPDHMDDMFPMDGDYDQGGVHYNSAILTHAQYKMYEALPSHFTKQNIGKLWYTALTMLAPDADFSDFKIILQQAAAQLGWDPSVIAVMDEAFLSSGIKGTEGAHTVTFHANGMTGSAPSPIICDYGQTFIIPECDLTAPRATLAGWSETGNHKSKVYLVGESYEMPAFDLTLYPVLAREIWNGLEPAILEGEGTQRAPYLIPDARALATVAYYFNNDVEKPWEEDAGPHFLFTADIDLENIPWIPIGSPADKPPESAYDHVPKPPEERTRFDGGGHVIRNLTICYEDPDIYPFQGLFGLVSETDILRLGIESGNIETAALYVGAIAGALQYGTVTDCFSNINVNNTASMIVYRDQVSLGSASGIVGYFIGEASSIAYCRNLGNISGYYAGGICAVQFMNVGFENCYNGGTISAKGMGGGIVGYSNHLTIINCINTGPVKGGNASYIGGICGSLNGISDSESMIAGCKNTGTLSSRMSGGMIGGFGGEQCSIVLQKNHYASQDAVSHFGYQRDNHTNTVSGDEPVRSSDSERKGDFAFGDAAYFLDPQYFSDISDASAKRLFDLCNNGKQFIVTWIIDSETETEVYAFDAMPQYAGTPNKADDAQYRYTFTGWTPSLSAVRDDIAYTAQFEQTLRSYTVTFVSEAQTVDKQTVFYGDLLTAPPAVTQQGYVFAGWFKDEECTDAFDAATETIASDMVLYAKWETVPVRCGCGTVDFLTGLPLLLLLLGTMVCLRMRTSDRSKKNQPA